MTSEGGVCKDNRMSSTAKKESSLRNLRRLGATRDVNQLTCVSRWRDVGATLEFSIVSLFSSFDESRSPVGPLPPVARSAFSALLLSTFFVAHYTTVSLSRVLMSFPRGTRKKKK